nr:fethred_a domain-containing protein (FTRA) [Polytomella parva]|mmetsp:Transcript_34119/g.61517  ORF Transcript_34119/g.61517 Transcript_34119/m.61517 type:complete len:110 (-) Transcript_34119:891-1220(-)
MILSKSSPVHQSVNKRASVAAKSLMELGAPAQKLVVGQKVKVIRPIKLFHVPKKPDGFVIEGLEGVVKADVHVYKGRTISPNFPYKIEFHLQDKIKFIAHLAGDELQVL